ncbi:hypothetical protein [Prosthecomicrobium sp. N25]|uniref:hypothetical protein n=1 Tax=Prosthecomicrobium sp. N25 TaxID=3129254 RepID=UPI003076C6A0
MSDRTPGRKPAGNVRSLQEAIRRMRMVSTERADGIADLQAAERARLEMLAEELADVFKAVPSETDIFAFSVSGGEPPRLWIDMTSHVAMGRDRRTYRFLKDTRLGRTVLRETDSLDAMADCITDYVAERVIEREKALEADWLLARGPRPETTTAAAASGATRPPAGRTRWRVLAAFALGVVTGAVGLFAWAASKGGL